MPLATFTKVREVSSEDNIHLAQNLINDLGKKWKTKNAGEKSAYVILEMSCSCQIDGIDIGNEHSAFVEVLVGKSGSAPEEFKEILITCSLMTPIESKSSNNINRVRCFNRDALVPSVAEDKWSLVKILCTQPFNKHVSYGLSFIKVHIGDNTISSSITRKKNFSEPQNNPIQVLGSLKFRENSPDSESENSSSLFNRWKKFKHNGDEQTTCAALKIASKNHKSIRVGIFNDQKPESLSLKKDINFTYHLSEKLDINRKMIKMELETEMKSKTRKSLDCCRKFLDDSTKKLSISKTSCDSNICPSLESMKDQLSSSQGNKVENIILFRPFNELLKHVVLVISGIQNPERGDLRNKAIALGATYKTDWDVSCTHLICAFKNTPKYNQVKGRGKIVTRRWIEKCYSLKKYLPWRRYALDSNELSKSESDEEIFDDTLHSEVHEISNMRSTTLSKSGGSDANHLASVLNSSSSESDTDDEIRRIQQSINTIGKDTTYKKVDLYETSTDEEDYINGKLSK